MTAVDTVRSSADRLRRHPPTWPADDARALLAVALLALRVLVAAMPWITEPSARAVAGAPAVLLVAGNVAALAAVARRACPAGPGVLLLVDVAAAYGAKLATGGLTAVPTGPFWYYLAATVALWTVVLGGAAGTVVAVGWFAVQGVVPGIDRSGLDPVAVAGQAVLLAAGLVAPWAVLRVAAGVRAPRGTAAGSSAWSDAVSAGRQQERREIRRWLHDGVVQTFETIALVASHRATPEALAEIRVLAAQNAAALRRAIDDRPAAPGRLSDALERVVAAQRIMGLRLDFTAAEIPSALPADRVAALRDATAEALRNVRKHAGSGRAQVNAVADRAAVRVEVRDYGSGFDVRDRPPGFGLSQSVAGRLRDVDGGCVVHSDVGAGTRIVMWIPR
jgi:signal transduction histidine kinase